MTGEYPARCEGLAPFHCGNQDCPAHPHLATDPECKFFCGIVAVPGGRCPTCNPSKETHMDNHITELQDRARRAEQIQRESGQQAPDYTSACCCGGTCPDCSDV